MNRSDRPAVSLLLLAVILAAATAAAVLVLGDRWAAAAVATAVTAVAVTVTGRRAKYTGDSLLTFADSVAERAADAAILGAVAWAVVGEDPAVSAAALTALVFGYLAAYIRAKGTGLGFTVQESLIARLTRAVLIVFGLAYVAALGSALWAASVVSLFSVIRQSAEVARQQEPA